MYIAFMITGYVLVQSFFGTLANNSPIDFHWLGFLSNHFLFCWYIFQLIFFSFCVSTLITCQVILHLMFFQLPWSLPIHLSQHFLKSYFLFLNAPWIHFLHKVFHLRWVPLNIHERDVVLLLARIHHYRPQNFKYLRVYPIFS